MSPEGTKMALMHLCRSAVVSVLGIPGQCQDLDGVSPAKCQDPDGVSPSRLMQGRCVMHHPHFISLVHPPGSRFLWGPGPGEQLEGLMA